MKTLLLGPEDVTRAASLPEVIDAVEGAFAADARGDTQMPVPAYIDARDDAGWEGAGVKWVNSHPENPDRHGLPTVMGTVVYSDPETAFPLSIMDGTTLTRLRTGAAAAVATRHLAREDATSLGLVGAGLQSYTQLEAIAEVRAVETVVVADPDPDAVETFRERYGDSYEVRAGSVAEAAACDVVSTTTPVREPVVHAVGDRTHVNAMGADAAGKHEIADSVLAAATLVIDDHEQCTHSGEINVPWSKGVLNDGDIHAELSAVVGGAKPGREPSDGATVFDSTGLAIQDVAAAHVVYERAREDGVGTEFALVGTE